ncbi:MAG: hypothetical protein U7126_05780 [Microcoleus sp.]
MTKNLICGNRAGFLTSLAGKGDLRCLAIGIDPLHEPFNECCDRFFRNFANKLSYFLYKEQAN